MPRSAHDPRHPTAPRQAQTHCVHCHRVCGDLAGGHARVRGEDVCSLPAATGRPDCYQLVTHHDHPLYSCPSCMDPTPHHYPDPPRGRLGLHRL
jgi:hypothetical protein